jgi:hypothetical protein
MYKNNENNEKYIYNIFSYKKGWATEVAHPNKQTD